VRVGDGAVEVEAAVGVDRELRFGPELGEHRLDARAILVDAGADLHLHDGVATVDVAAHLAAQRARVLARVVVPPAA
jgi:hypothetical protein